jgi:hypothetical protein
MATYTGTPKSSSRRQLVLVGLAALAVGLAVGLGADRVDLHRHRSSSASQVQPQGGSQASSLPATGSTAAEQPGNGSETGGASAAITSSLSKPASIPYLYLVGSAAQANDVQQGLDWVAITSQPLEATVLVVPPEVSGGEVAESVNEFRRMGGLVPVTVEDLRTPAASAAAQSTRSSADGVTSDDRPMGGAAEFLRDHPPVQPAGGEGSSVPATTSSGTTAGSTASLYLVGSTAQADDVQQRLDQVRATIGFQPLDATVLVVGREASADEVAWLRTTLNAARQMQGLAPLTVVDLRTPDTSAPPPQAPPSCPDPDVVPYSGIC